MGTLAKFEIRGQEKETMEIVREACFCSFVAGEVPPFISPSPEAPLPINLGFIHTLSLSDPLKVKR